MKGRNALGKTFYPKNSKLLSIRYGYVCFTWNNYFCLIRHPAVKTKLTFFRFKIASRNNIS